MIFSWGSNSHGQLGSDNKEDCTIPVQCHINTEVDVVSLTGGGSHTVLLTKLGKVYSCGQNKHGQLGHPDCHNEVLVPKMIDTLPAVVTKVVCGWNHTLAISAGDVYGWGSNLYGQIGAPARQGRNPIPVKLPRKFFDEASVIEVKAGLKHSVALTESGAVFTWGDGKKGQLGHDDTTGVIIEPKQVVGIKCSVIAAGAYHTAAVSGTGQVWCWGCNRHGQCGVGDSGVAKYDESASSTAAAVTKGATKKENILKPQVVVSLQSHSIKKLSCGWSHMLAIDEEKRLFGWGRCDYGQLGIGTELPSVKSISVPTKIMENVNEVACGSEHSIALTGDGSVVTWGWNEHGMCATGNEENVFLPHNVRHAPVAGLRAVMIGAGGGHSLVKLEASNSTSTS